MAPCKPAKSLKVRVPRQNAQRLGPSLTRHVRTVAQRERTIVQVPPPVQEQPGAAGASSENSSEWNSLLLSARAQRGPFWDVGTQQFLVEKESELYYDATPLLEATRSLTESNNASASQSQSSNPNTATTSAQQRQLQIQQQQRQAAFSAQQYPYPNPNNNGTPMMAHATGTPTRGGMGYPVTPGAGGPQGQYFGDGAGTPSRGGMMNGVSATPEGYGRRITRGMSDGYPVYAN